MDLSPRTPWRPARSWADPLIALLALLVGVLAIGGGMARAKRRSAPPEQVSQAARLQDLLNGFQQQLPMPLPLQPRPLSKALPWDRALQALAQAERGQLEEARPVLEEPAPPGPAGLHLRHAWRRAYLNEGASIQAAELRALQTALGDGWTAQRLGIRLAEQEGKDVRPLEHALARETRIRLLGLGMLGLTTLVVALAGMGFALYQFVRKPPHPLRVAPYPAYSGRGLLLVMLVWFLASQVLPLGPLFLAHGFPRFKPFMLPTAYLMHAWFGVVLLAGAEGCSVGTLLRRRFARPTWSVFRQSLGFFALAVAAVLAIGLALSPFLPPDAEPQQELMELMGRTHGVLPTLLLFATVSIVAPLFEELLFRGELLTWLEGTRVAPYAVLLSGVAFGAMHLQLEALPTLSALGILFGWACVRTRNLWTSVFMHALWNGGVFCFLRLLG